MTQAALPGQRTRASRSGRLLKAASGLALVAMWAWAGAASADGGHIAWRATSAAYSLTLFTAPDPLVTGLCDLSLLVQDPSTGGVLSDVSATATLSAPGVPPSAFSLTRAAASNKLLLAASPELPAPGTYTLVLRVQRPGSLPAGFTVLLPVAADHRRRTTLFFALALPLLIILLFLVNQHAKSRRPRVLH